MKHLRQKESKAKKGNSSSKRIPLGLILLIFLIGIVARGWLLDLGSRKGYNWDHFDNISMGLGARRSGLFHIYTIEKEDVAVVPGQIYQKGQFVPYERRPIFLPNYPPLTLASFWLQTGLLPEPIEANTFGARIIMASVPFLAELLTAVGVGLICLHLFGRRAAIWAGCLCWLMPPIILNSTFFLQIDSLVFAPGVFMLFFMLRRRWILAGLTLALACLMKPQGLILGPIASFAAIVIPAAQGTTGFRCVLVRLLKLGGAFVAAVLLITLPWMITSGLAWAERSYYVSFIEAFPTTTLKAFNIWYLDALLLDANPIPNALNSEATIAGLTKDTWGRVLMLGAMFGFAGLCWWRYRRSPMGVLLYSGLLLWSVFMLPTRVHERFIIYCVPFVLLAAMRLKRLIPVLVLLLIVATAEHSWTIWLKGWPAGSYNPEQQYQMYLYNYKTSVAKLPPSRRPRAMSYLDFIPRYRQQYEQSRPDARSREYLMTILSLLCYACGAVAPFVKVPATEKLGNLPPPAT